MKKNYTISIPVRTFWTVILPAGLLIIIAGGITGMVLLDRFVMPRVTGVQNRGVIKVPDIVSMSCENARQSLYDIGLRLEVQSREFNDTLAENVVISQKPAPNEKVKRGRHILVMVSRGAEIGRIPDVRNLTERAAKKMLREAGFSNIKVYRSYNEKFEKDLIALTSPAHGVRTSREIPVEITISKGPKPTHVVVPNLVGEVLSDAKQVVEENGLKVGDIQYKVNPAVRPGSVVSQSLSPGANVPLESSIDLVVSASM
jgi:serine/threonine-protein kinase